MTEGTLRESHIRTYEWYSAYLDRMEIIEISVDDHGLVSLSEELMDTLLSRLGYIEVRHDR